MSRDSVLGWDVGGAHLKVALVDEDGAARSALELPCPLWRGIEHLERAIGTALRQMPYTPAMHAVTMTGELSDCFPDRAGGVAAIAATLAQHVAAERLRFFAGHCGFVGHIRG